jgi:TolB-like protein
MKSMVLALVVGSGALVAPMSPLHDISPVSHNAKTVAVLYFDNNTGSADYDNLGRGMASMMISDLSSVKDIQLVEREHMQDVLKEQDAQHTRYFDQSTAVQTGKLLGAEYIVTGAFIAMQPTMRIDTRVIRVQTGEIVKTAKVTGEQDKLFDLQQRLADSLIDGLAIALSPEQRDQLRAQQQRDRIDHLSTMTSYSQALTMFDRGDYAGAVQKMQPVVQDAPNSMLVQLTYDEMKRRAASSMKEKAKDKINTGLRSIFKRP